MRELEEGESVIDSPDEVLRRQVAPALFQDGVIMKAAFDDDQTQWLSTLREAVSPEEAYRRWTEDDEHPSVGTYGVVVGFANSLGLPCVDDSEALQIADHASVVLEDVATPSQRVKVARKLRDAAAALGPLYVPPANT